MNTTTALAALRRIYSATLCPLTDPERNANDSDTGARDFARQCVNVLLAAGEIEKARKVVAAFENIAASLSPQHLCHLRTWKLLPGASQRAALEMAGRTCPLRQDRFGTSVDAAKFTFND